MKYKVRFVFYYYDEFDTTLANIYDVIVRATNPYEALDIAEKIVLAETRKYRWPGYTEFISLTDENELVYVSSLVPKNYFGVRLPIPLDNRLVVLRSEDYKKLPKTFCFSGETFFIIDEDKVMKMGFSKIF